MSTAASHVKRERDDAVGVSSEDDYFTPDSSASPTPYKKPRSPSTTLETNVGTTVTGQQTPPLVKAEDTAATTAADPSMDPSTQLERIFKNLRLRRIVKENHSSEINQLAFCQNHRYNRTPYGIDRVRVLERRGAILKDPTDNSNVLATTGGPQANIYDNEHCGDHLDIMSHFLLDPTGEEGFEELPEMLTCCWMNQPQDAILATAGTDKMIHILSLARSKELMRLSGHKHTITDIQPHPIRDEYILSASKDGTIRLWNILTGNCLVIFEYKASVVCFNPHTQGTTFLSGSYNGDIREWDMPSFDEEPKEPIVVPLTESRMLQSGLHSARIDCIRFAKNKVLSKSVNGKIEYWDSETLEHIRTFTVKNTASNQCRFDVSLDELFFCVGTSNGSVYIYNIQTGKTVTELKHRRSTKAIRTCIFSRDSRTVMCAGEDSFIWRYDYVTDETLNEWAAWKPES